MTSRSEAVSAVALGGGCEAVLIGAIGRLVDPETPLDAGRAAVEGLAAGSPSVGATEAAPVVWPGADMLRSVAVVVLSGTVGTPAAPPGVSLADPEIPIASTITFDAEPYEGFETLQVKANLAVVYELRQGSDVRVVVRQFVQNYTFYHPREVADGDNGPYVSSPGGSGFCIDQDEVGRGLLAADATEADPTCAAGILTAIPTPA